MASSLNFEFYETLTFDEINYREIVEIGENWIIVGNAELIPSQIAYDLAFTYVKKRVSNYLSNLNKD